MDLDDIVRNRYAARTFDGSAVSDETIDAIVELMRLAPTSFNLQPWRLQIVRDAELRRSLLPASFGQPQLTTCSHLLVICADLRLEEAASRMEGLMREAGIPAARRDPYMEVVRQFIGQLTGEARLHWAQKQAYIALAHGLLAAQSRGLDACPMEGFIPAEYARILGLPEHLVPSVLIALGRASGDEPPKLRFPTEEMVVDS